MICNELDIFPIHCHKQAIGLLQKNPPPPPLTKDGSFFTTPLPPGFPEALGPLLTKFARQKTLPPAWISMIFLEALYLI